MKMEQDNDLKKMLSIGAFEETSSDFTDQIMQRIEAAEINKSSLISPLVKKFFVMAFIIVSVAVLIMAVVIKTTPDFPVLQYIKLPQITPTLFYKTVTYLTLFWLLILINHLTANIHTNRSHRNNFQQ